MNNIALTKVKTYNKLLKDLKNLLKEDRSIYDEVQTLLEVDERNIERLRNISMQIQQENPKVRQTELIEQINNIRNGLDYLTEFTKSAPVYKEEHIKRMTPVDQQHISKDLDTNIKTLEEQIGVYTQTKDILNDMLKFMRGLVEEDNQKLAILEGQNKIEQ